VQQASKPIFAQRTIYIPVFYDQLLMFSIQLENDVTNQLQSLIMPATGGALASEQTKKK